MSDKAGQNKRTVKKTNKCIKTMNIKISTEDKDAVKSNSKSPKKTNKKNTTKNNNANLTQKSEVDIFQKTKQLQNELNKLNLTIKTEAEKDFDEINSLKTNISELENQQVELSKENKKLISKLKGLENDINQKFSSKFKLSKIVANQKKLANKTDIEKQIKSKEKQVETAQKNMKYMEKEYAKLSDMVEKSKNGEDKILEEELSGISKKIEYMESEIQKLLSIRAEHESCEKKRLLLISQINVLSNEIEFESKKQNIPMGTLPTIGKEKKGNSESKKKKEDPKNPTKSMEYSQKIRKDLFKDVEKYNTRAQLAKYKIFNALKKEFEEKSDENFTSRNVNGENKNQVPQRIGYSLSSIAYLKEIKSKIDDSAPKKNLFSEKDKEILQKLIPENNLNSLNERYNNIETEINKMDEEKTKENKEIKNKTVIFVGLAV